MKTIEIRSFTGKVLFTYSCKGNNLRTTVVEAVRVGANLTGANLTGANLTGADLRRTDLTDANLTDANLYGANLTGANLTDAILTEANLRRANLRRANLTDANLRFANLTGTYLRGADLTDANLTDANLTDASLWNTTGNDIHIKNIPNLAPYDVCYTSEMLQVGCQQHTFEEWLSFSDEDIEAMDGEEALDFWAEHKAYVFKVIESNPAIPTKEVV